MHLKKLGNTGYDQGKDHWCNKYIDFGLSTTTTTTTSTTGNIVRPPG